MGKRSEVHVNQDTAVPDVELTALMAQYERQIYNYLLVLLNDPDAALDCAQETFLRGYQQLGQGKSVTGSWLYRVAHNLAMDLFRRRAKLPTEPLDEELPPPVEWSPPVDDAPVRQALARLSLSDRELLYLAHVDGLRVREIAAVLQTREGAVRMRLLRAHRRFIALYGEPK